MKNILFLLLVTVSSCFSQTIDRIDLTDSTWISIQRPSNILMLESTPKWYSMPYIIPFNTVYDSTKRDTIQIEISFSKAYPRVTIDFDQELPEGFFDNCKGLDIPFLGKRYTAAYIYGKLFTEEQVKKNIIDYLNKQGYIVTSK